MLARIRDQGICAHPAASKPALLCNPPAHRTNPLHRAEFRPNTTTPSFYHSIPHQLDHLPLYNRFVCKPFQMRIQFRHFPEISECPLLALKLAAPSSRAFPSAAPRRLSSDRRNTSLPTARGESWVYFGFLFEHLCEKPVLLSHLFHVTEPKLAADFIFVQYSFYNFLRK